jgi:hypothetical protein
MPALVDLDRMVSEVPVEHVSYHLDAIHDIYFTRALKFVGVATIASREMSIVVITIPPPAWP